MPLSVSSWWDSLASGLGTRPVVRGNDPGYNRLWAAGSHTFASLSLEPHLSPTANNMPVKVSFSISHSRQTLWKWTNKTQRAPEQNHQLSKFPVFSTTVVKICEVNCLISLGEYRHMCIFSNFHSGKGNCWGLTHPSTPWKLFHALLSSFWVMLWNGHTLYV